MTIGNTLIGATLGPYEIESLLGRGGMAIVYRAFDTTLQRQVAIKVLADAVADQPGFVARFRQEAQLLAGLKHPHIVQIYDLGEYDGIVYMAQELLPGPTLEQRLAELKRRDARPSRDEILAIARQVASALDAAHAAGIIHRDIKPSNMLWNAAGELVLADFGVAKALQEERLTQTGTILGTPTYLSPEQAQGQPLTPSSDIYSLGVVLYELIAGRPPFEGATAIAVALSHVQRQPPALRRWRADLPRPAEVAVLRALAKQPAARFHTAGELVHALETTWPAAPRLATSATIAMRTALRADLKARIGAPRMLTALSVMLALFMAGGGWMALRQPTYSAAAPIVMLPSFGAFEPTAAPAPDFVAAPAAATAPTATETSVPTPPAVPDAPTVAPVAAAAPPAAAPVAVPVGVQPAVPASHSSNQPATSNASSQPASRGAQLPNPPKPNNVKPPKPDKPKPGKPKPAAPKPDKPKDHGKGGGKGK